MAYTSAPETQTYASVRMPIAYGIDLRPGSTSTFQKDAGMINVIPFKRQEAGEEVIWGETRYGINAQQVVSAAGSICRGMYVWEKSIGTTYIFVVVGTSVYSSTGGTFSLVNTLLTNVNTPVRFTEFIDATNVKKLVLVDGVEGYVYTTNAAGTKITDVDFPTPHVPFPVFIDGYLFLAKAGTGDIYNSDLNDPAIWTAGSFISSELYPDDIQALLKVNNYLLAVGTQGCEYFYDAANATASPLARYEGASLPFGTSFPNAIASNKDTVILLANSGDGEGVLKKIEDFKHTDIPCEFVLSLLNTSVNSTGPGVIRGYLFRQQSELFYGLCFNGTLTSASPTSVTTPTFAFSFSTGQWFELNYKSSFVFPVYFTSLSTSDRLYTSIAGSYEGKVFFGLMSSLSYRDSLDGVATDNILQELRTKVFDFGTLNGKTMSRVGLVYTANTIPGNFGGITLYATDDAWDSFSQVRTMTNPSVSSTEGFPFITQLGRFRQRAFKITFASTNQVRWKALEFDINKGQQ